MKTPTLTAWGSAELAALAASLDRDPDNRSDVGYTEGIFAGWSASAIEPRPMRSAGVVSFTLTAATVIFCTVMGLRMAIAFLRQTVWIRRSTRLMGLSCRLVTG